MKQNIRKQKLKWRRKFRTYEKRLLGHPKLFTIAVSVSLLAIVLTLVITLRDNTIRLNPRDAHIVLLHVDDETRAIPTREETVEGLLKHAGIKINTGDIVEPGLDTKIYEDDFRVNVYRAAPVTIVEGNTRLSALSAGRTPRNIVEQAGVKLYPEDIVKASPSTDFLSDGLGQTVTVDRATPATLNVYGTSLSVRTHAETVGDLLKEKGVKLANDDTVQPGINTPLTPLTQVFVTRFGIQVSTSEEVVPFAVQVVDDPSLSFGTQVVRQAGANGKKSVTYQLELRNGTVINRTLIQEVTTVDAVPQIVARGRAVSIPADIESTMRAAGISANDFPFVNYIVAHESGWCPTKMQGQIGYCPGYAPTSFPAGLGYGLCQSTPGTKMASAGADWQTNPVTQLRWCTSYAGRYGGWEGAYNFWLSHHWW